MTRRGIFSVCIFKDRFDPDELNRQIGGKERFDINRQVRSERSNTWITADDDEHESRHDDSAMIDVAIEAQQHAFPSDSWRRRI